MAAVRRGTKPRSIGADAKPSALVWPRTRTVLERIAAGYEVDAAREGQSAEQRDWRRSGDASPSLSLAFVHEDLPGRAPANSAVVTTVACFAMTMSSSIACTSPSGSAQQSRTTTNR